MSGKTLNRVLDNPSVRERLERPRKIVRDYDMPYVGGYSVDGETIYLDRHLPYEIPLELDGQKKVVRPEEFLAEYLGHEPVEWSVMDALGWTYEHAHSGPATGAERRKVLTYLGPGWWSVWQKAIERYVKADEHEKIEKIPEDYDLRPVLSPPVNRALVAQIEKAMGKTGTKLPKEQVEYTDQGHPAAHCGPVKAWSRGMCENFQAPNSCSLVRGYINPKGWCYEWESQEETDHR